MLIVERLAGVELGVGQIMDCLREKVERIRLFTPLPPLRQRQILRNIIRQILLPFLLRFRHPPQLNYLPRGLRPLRHLPEPKLEVKRVFSLFPKIAVCGLLGH